MGVDPAYRGLGNARRLINECIARAADAGASTFCLHTAAFMPAAIRLYEGLGFVRAPEYDFDGGVHFRSGDVAVPVIAYTRPVARAQASSGRSRRSSLTAR